MRCVNCVHSVADSGAALQRVTGLVRTRSADNFKKELRRRAVMICNVFCR